MVHLGMPDSNASDITMSFPDHLKDFASGETYPTRPENALRATIYGQASVALDQAHGE